MTGQHIHHLRTKDAIQGPFLAPSGCLPAIALDRWQYRLTNVYHPEAEALDRLWLSVGEGLPVIRVTQCGGQSAGVLLGFPIDLKAKRVVRGHWQTPNYADFDTEEGIHQTLRALGGRFVWITPFAGGLRLYPDAAAQVTCVWDPKSKSAGATSGAILPKDAYKKRFDKALFDQLQIKGEGWFPAGLTAHKGVRRLLPNHYLDLRSWTTQRFAAVTSKPAEPKAVLIAVETAIRDQIAALSKGPDKLTLALTAGRESRAILACLKDQAADLQFVTVTGGDRHQTDTRIAKRITSSLGLNHIALPRQVADQAAQDTFLRRSGHCFGDSNMAYHQSVHPLAPDHVFSGGLGGEIARAFYWSDLDPTNMKITADLLMKRFGLRRSDPVLNALDDWLTGLPDLQNARDILDLAYLELRLGPWAMAQFCADPTVVRYAPMITYETVRLMLDLPESWKVERRLNEAIVARNWPELNRFPYNSLGRFQDNALRLRRVIGNPRLLIKKLRQRHNRT